jgi:hypothetical protein
MNHETTPKIENLDQQEAELTPEQAEAAQGGAIYMKVEGFTSPERNVVNHEEQ